MDGDRSNGCEAACEPVASPREYVCDGVDDECDGDTGEDFVGTPCGEGLSCRTSVCGAGTELGAHAAHAARDAAGRSMHRLILIPWDIGNQADLTIRAVREVRRLRVFLAEDPALSRRHFARLLPEGAAGKRLFRLPALPRPAFLRRILGLLEREDVGLVSSGGVPCFIDPGAWVVRELRERGVHIVPLAGPSGLGTLLSLSGIDWTMDGLNRFTFVFFCRPHKGDVSPVLREALARAGEPIVIFLLVPDLRHCLRAIAAGGGGRRRVSIFFDMTKTPTARFPYADQVRTLTAREWLRVYPRVRWDRVSDLALLVHRLELPRP